jgi:predicted TIM-barrel fold metal-dependent hydrolase
MSRATIVAERVRRARTLGYFHLTLERTNDGSWRIASEVPVFPGPRVQQPQIAADLVRYLDEAGIRRAVVLSDGYYFDSPKLPSNGLEKVRAENDWTAEQVAQFPDRLVAFCSFNPLRTMRLPSSSVCAASGRFTGIKLHFGMSGVDLRNSDHVAKVRRVVEAANRHRMPLIVHVRAGADYGREHARVLLDRIVSAAPDVVFQIAHTVGRRGLFGRGARRLCGSC